MNREVLIIEDDKFISGTLARKFESSGFVVYSAKNAEEAMDLLKTKTPHVIILDIILPHTNGLDILKLLKADSKTKAIPVIILSNLDSKENIDEAMKLGAKNYLVKVGFTPGQVVTEVNKILAQ